MDRGLVRAGATRLLGLAAFVAVGQFVFELSASAVAGRRIAVMPSSVVPAIPTDTRREKATAGATSEGAGRVGPARQGGGKHETRGRRRPGQKGVDSNVPHAQPWIVHFFASGWNASACPQTQTSWEGSEAALTAPSAAS